MRTSRRFFLLTFCVCIVFSLWKIGKFEIGFRTFEKYGSSEPPERYLDLEFEKENQRTVSQKFFSRWLPLRYAVPVRKATIAFGEPSDVEFASKLTGLEDLSIVNTPVDNAILTKLNGHKKLRILRIRANYKESQTWIEFPILKELEILHLSSSTITKECLSSFESLSKLAELSVCVVDDSLSKFPSLPFLRRLILNHTSLDPSLNLDSILPNLEAIRMDSRGGTVSCLPSSTNLKTLAIEASEIPLSALVALKQYQAIEELDLGVLVKDSRPIRMDELEKISLPHLKRLSIQYKTPENEEDNYFPPSFDFPNIESLAIRNLRLTQRRIVSLASLVKLTELSIAGAELTENDCLAISSIKLRKVTLANSIINVSQLKILSRIENLEELKLHWIKSLSASELTQVFFLFSRLQSVSLLGFDLTLDDRKELHLKYPNIKFEILPEAPRRKE